MADDDMPLDANRARRDRQPFWSIGHTRVLARRAGEFLAWRESLNRQKGADMDCAHLAGVRDSCASRETEFREPRWRRHVGVTA
jgi:hypothetical protein